MVIKIYRERHPDVQWRESMHQCPPPPPTLSVLPCTYPGVDLVEGAVLQHHHAHVRYAARLHMGTQTNRGVSVL